MLPAALRMNSQSMKKESRVDKSSVTNNYLWKADYK